MKLKDLIGVHRLDAVDFENVSLPAYEGADYTKDSSVCRFRLDGKVYAAIEDPDDGYRSSMRELSLVRKARMKNTFAPIKVFCTHTDKSGYDSADLLFMYDLVTAKLVLTVGTDKADDYYPSFVANFQPENMAVNA